MTSTLPPSLSFVVAAKDLQYSPVQDSKDLRAFEHARDHARTHEQRVRKTTLAKSPVAKLSKGRAAAWTSTLGLSQREVEDASTIISLPATPAEPPVVWGQARVPAEVQLSDLITIKKGRKRPAGDFVLVPSVASVIVLDDPSNRDFIAEEAWECIDSDEDSHSDSSSKSPSYAAILAFGA